MRSENVQNIVTPFGFDPGATRDVGTAFYEDESKTLANGSCPGHHQGVVLAIDAYNQQTSESDFKPLTNSATDSDHVPIVCIEGNGSRPSHSGDGFKECDDMYTLNATEVHAVCAPMNWDGSQTSPTLTANNAGGHSECLTKTISTVFFSRFAKMNESIGALCARDYKGCSLQWADENKFVILKNDSSLGLKMIAPCHCGTNQALTGGQRGVYIG